MTAESETVFMVCAFSESVESGLRQCTGMKHSADNAPQNKNGDAGKHDDPNDLDQRQKNDIRVFSPYLASMR